jgi:hypothetical protein
MGQFTLVQSSLFQFDRSLIANQTRLSVDDDSARNRHYTSRVSLFSLIQFDWRPNQTDFGLPESSLSV